MVGTGDVFERILEVLEGIEEKLEDQGDALEKGFDSVTEAVDDLGGGSGPSQPEKGEFDIDTSKGGTKKPKKGEKGKGALGYAFDAMPKALQGVINGFLSVGKALGPAGVIAGVVAGLAGFAVAVYAAAEGLIAANKGLARFNGQIAAAYAQSNVRDLQRNIASADRRSDALADLISTVDDFKDQIQPAIDLGFNLISRLLQAIIQMFTWVLQKINFGGLAQKGIELLDGILGEGKKANKKENKLLPGAEFFMARMRGDQRLDTRFAF